MTAANYQLEYEPYHTNSREYFRAHVQTPDLSYWTWIMDNFRCVSLRRPGSYCDNSLAQQYWGFMYERDRDWFALRWA